MWDLIVSVPDHCLSFYSETENWNMIGKKWLRYLDKKNMTLKTFFINALTLKDCKLLFRQSFTKTQYSHGSLSKASYKLTT